VRLEESQSKTQFSLSTASGDASVAKSDLPTLFNQAAFMDELQKSKESVRISRAQFEAAIDDILIDDLIYRLGAAERHLNYLFQLARKYHLKIERSLWEV